MAQLLSSRNALVMRAAVLTFACTLFTLHLSLKSTSIQRNENEHRILPRIKLENIHYTPPTSSPLHFSYDVKNRLGPQNWQYVDVSENEWLQYIDKPDTNLHRTEKNMCNLSRLVSPINIIHPDEECTATHEILTKDRNPNQCTISDFTFSITSSGLRASAPFDNKNCIRPTIDLPNGFPFPWVLNWIEIKARSEHLLNGRRYDAEMVMAHLGRDEHNNQVAFVSIMLDSTTAYYEGDDRLEAYLNQWGSIQYATARKCKQHIDAIRQLNKPYPFEFDHGNDSLKPFPYDIWPTEQFYRYRGSTTTPPCTSMVHWRVLDTPLKISRRQFKRIALLINNAMDLKTCQYITAASSTGEVNRPLQKFDYETQNMYHCTSDYF